MSFLYAPKQRNPSIPYSAFMPASSITLRQRSSSPWFRRWIKVNNRQHPAFSRVQDQF
jgi:hypothetical protein